jgi:hypothetical protein
MGCFDSTCAVSNYPVHHGDKVICFYLSKFESDMYNNGKWGGKYGGGNTYSLMQFIGGFLNRKKYAEEELIDPNLSEIHREYLEETIRIEYPFTDIVIGEYNDYGDVEGIDHKYDDLVWFFIRWDVWEFFSKQVNIPVDDFILLLQQILFVCYIAHHDILMAGTLVGEQYYQQNNLKDYDLIDECRQIARFNCFNNNERFLNY